MNSGEKLIDLCLHLFHMIHKQSVINYDFLSTTLIVMLWAASNELCMLKRSTLSRNLNKLKFWLNLYLLVVL